MRILALLNCLLAVQLASAQAVPGTNAALDRVARADNALGFKLLAATRKAATGGNVFQSPLGLALALGMAGNGARGQTLDQIAATLQMPGDAPSAWNGGNQMLLGRLSGRIPMKADTCSNPCRTPFRSCRTVVGAKRRSVSLIMGCPTGVKVSPPVLHSFGAPSRGDALTIHPKTSSRRLFGRAVSGGNELSNSSSRCRRSLRVTDSPARPNRRAWD